MRMTPQGYNLRVFIEELESRIVEQHRYTSKRELFKFMTYLDVYVTSEDLTVSASK